MRHGASAQISETAYHSFKSQDQAIILLVSRLLALRAHWAQWSGNFSKWIKYPKPKNE